MVRTWRFHAPASDVYTWTMCASLDLSWWMHVGFEVLSGLSHKPTPSPPPTNPTHPFPTLSILILSTQEWPLLSKCLCSPSLNTKALIIQLGTWTVLAANAEMQQRSQHWQAPWLFFRDGPGFVSHPSILLFLILLSPPSYVHTWVFANTVPLPQIRALLFVPSQLQINLQNCTDRPFLPGSCLTFSELLAILCAFSLLMLLVTSF
jgi:hypothetical protein